MEISAQITTSLRAMPWLEKSAQHDTSGGHITLADICFGAEFWSIDADGEQVGAFATKLVHYERGAVLYIQACAANVPGIELSPPIINVWEKIARQVGAKQIAVETVRSGAVKKATDNGFVVGGVMLHKRIER